MREDFLGNPVIFEDMERIFAARDSWEELRGAGIYVTGAAGMIASYLVMFFIYLNEEKDFGIRIYAGIRSGEKARRRFGAYVERDYFCLVRADASEAPGPELRADYILHAASPASPQFYGRMPVETMLPNVVGTVGLLEYAGKNRCRGMLFFSSGSVYGSVSGVESIGEDTVGTMDFLAPGNVYGESKRCGEALCKAYFREYGVPVRMARIHHTYGPTLDPVNDRRVFAEFTGNILRGQDIVLKSDGRAKRAFCYLTDTTAALLKILLDGEPGESYNVGNAAEYVSIRELAQKLVFLFPEKRMKVVCEERTEAGYQASPESRLIPLNLDKTRALGWEPAVCIEEGFRRTVRALEGTGTAFHNKPVDLRIGTARMDSTGEKDEKEDFSGNPHVQ